MTTDAPDSSARRPLTSRSTGWARSMAAWLSARRVPPNAISFFSIVAAGGGAFVLQMAAWGLLPGWLGWVALALGVQVRLICNLMDGMVAVEGGHKTPTGDLWNEVPDRVADTLVLLAAGNACGQVTLGWVGALLAMGAAYLRVLGASLTGRHDFGGPMAKPQRMALITVAALIAAAWRDVVMEGALVLLVLGTVLTCCLRLRRVARLLSSAEHSQT